MDTCEIKESEESIDRISALPDDVREFILGYLLITDAVRTSGLSRKWRYSWTRSACLNIRFDHHMIRKMDYKSYRSVVNNVLSLHVGEIHKIVLHHTERSPEDELNALLLLVSRKNVKDLGIQRGEGTEKDDLPSSIFQCIGLFSLTLEHFSLKDSITFKGFPNLTTLRLFHVDIFGDVLEKFISGCPLEELVIHCCCFYTNRQDSKIPMIAITSHSLRTLGIVCMYHKLCHCYLKYAPNLKVASFSMSCLRDKMGFLASDCLDYLGSVPTIKDLTVDCRLHKTSSFDGIPKRLPKLLVNLKTLTLRNVDVISLEQTSFIFRIIKSSPNLQNLAILMETADWQCERFSKNHLKTVLAFIEVESKEKLNTNITTLSVTFEDPKRIKADIALIKNIVSWCPTLGKLFIKVSSFIENFAERQLLKAVREFSRAPSKPEIIYSEMTVLNFGVKGVELCPC